MTRRGQENHLRDQSGCNYRKAQQCNQSVCAHVLQRTVEAKEERQVVTLRVTIKRLLRLVHHKYLCLLLAKGWLHK